MTKQIKLERLKADETKMINDIGTVREQIRRKLQRKIKK